MQDSQGPADNIIDELVLIERRSARGAALLQSGFAKSAIEAIDNVCNEFQKSWSGSWIGYQSKTYYGDFAPAPPGAVFSIEWGALERRISNPTRGDWREHAYEDITGEILRRSGEPNLEKLQGLGAETTEVFTQCQEELVATLDAASADSDDRRLVELREAAGKVAAFVTPEALAQHAGPRQIMSRDAVAKGQGVMTPAHIAVRSQVQSIASRSYALTELGAVARQTRLYLEKRLSMSGNSVARTAGKVFIGHGKSAAWRDLKDLLRERLELEPDEFNLQAAAGMTTKERLEEMLESAVFAFLVMTAEDEHADGTRHARENVIHEAGLFQGRLGFRRAILLLEEGCSEFSNVTGIVQIRFPKGKIVAKSEEIRGVLEREGLLPGRRAGGSKLSGAAKKHA